MSPKFVILFIACILLGSNHLPLQQSRAAARLLDDNLSGGDGRGKVIVNGSPPRKDGSWTGNSTSPSGKILMPPPHSTTMFKFKSSNATSRSPGSFSSANSTVLVKTVTPTGRPLPSVTIAMAPSIATPGYAHASPGVVTIKGPGAGFPGNSNP